MNKIQQPGSQLRWILFFLCAGLCLPAADREKAPRLTAYVMSIMSHSVSVIDLDGGQEVRRLAPGRYPLYSSLYPADPNKLLLVLHNYERTEDDDALVLFDLQSEQVVRKVPFPGAGMPSGFVYDARRGRIYIADENRQCVTALDAATLDPLFTFPAGLIPVHVDISPDNRWLAVTNRKSADLYVYDLDDREHSVKSGMYTIHVGKSPDAAWSPGGPAEGVSHPLDIHFANEPNLCYVSDWEMRQLLVVDIARREVVARVPLGGIPFDFALNREKTVAYVCLVEGDAVAVVDLVNKKVTGEIKGLRTNPIHCALDEESGRLVVACWGGAKEAGVYVADIKTLKVLSHFPLKGEAASIGITLVRRP